MPYSSLDPLVAAIRNINATPDGELRAELAEVAIETLNDYVDRGEITAEAREMLIGLLVQPSD